MIVSRKDASGTASAASQDVDRTHSHKQLRRDSRANASRTSQVHASDTAENGKYTGEVCLLIKFDTQ